MVVSSGRSSGLGAVSGLLVRVAGAACLLWLAVTIGPGAADAAAGKKAGGVLSGGLKADLSPKGGAAKGGYPGWRAQKADPLAGKDKGLCDECLRGDIGCDQTVAGSLAPGDCSPNDGSYVDTYRMELPEDARVSVNLRSASFDTYLVIVEEGCSAVIAANDDCEGTNSCLTVGLGADTYFILVTSYSVGETGTYSLEVACLPPLCEECLQGEISCGETVAGTLNYRDCDLGDGSYVDIFRFDLERPASLTINMSSASFDTFLFLASPGCQIIDGNDDCGSISLSCLTMTLAAGTYFIFANSYDPGATGAYELEVTECVCPDPAPPHDPFPPDGERDVPVATRLAWNGASAPAGGDAGRRKIIYGADDRRDEYQITDADLLSAGDATVAVVARSELTDNGDGTYSLPATSFAQYYADTRGRPLCADEPFRAQPVPAFCSGALVDPQLVFTAGHCVTGSAECADTAFVFGFVMTDATTPVVRVPASEVYFCAGILARRQSDADWGLIRLDRPVTGHLPLAVRREGAISVGERLVAIGHPVGMPRKYDAGATVREGSSPDFFQANLDAYGGNSGSAVLNRDTLEVEGILVRGWPDFVEAGACDRSNRCPDEGCPGWEDVTRATAFSHLLPTYDVYLGRSADALELTAAGLGASWCDPDPLVGGATYYWQVAVRDICAEVRGPIWSFTTAGASTPFRRGDVNGDGRYNIADAIAVLAYLFGNNQPPSCRDAADANDDGVVGIADPITILSYLFSDTGLLPPPFEVCGEDPTGDGVDCQSYAPCQQ